MIKKNTHPARRKAKRNGYSRVSVDWLKSRMPKYVVPSIHDSPEYCRGYGDAIAELHNLLTQRSEPVRPATTAPPQQEG